MIISKSKPRRKKIYDRQKKASRDDDQHQGLFHSVDSPEGDFIAFHALFEDAANHHVNDESD